LEFNVPFQHKYGYITDENPKCDFRVSPFCQVVQSTTNFKWHSKASFDCLLYR